jgi:hypothetical protein
MYVFCMDLKTNSDFLPLYNWMTRFHNWNWHCLLRGTSRIFKYNSG